MANIHPSSIPVLKRQKEENGFKFQTILGYISRCKPGWSTYQDSFSKIMYIKFVFFSSLKLVGNSNHTGKKYYRALKSCFGGGLFIYVFIYYMIDVGSCSLGWQPWIVVHPLSAFQVLMLQACSIIPQGFMHTCQTLCQLIYIPALWKLPITTREAVFAAHCLYMRGGECGPGRNS